MIEENVHRLLILFGDAKQHTFFEIVTLGRVLLKMPDRKLEKFFKRHLLENVWVRRCGNSWDPRLDSYQLTEKGDEFLRSIQIWRVTRGKHSEDMVRHFKQFNRQATGRYGAEGLGENISEVDAHLPETHPHLYG